jgi:Sec-independent protein translocase protein TatA
MDFMGMGVLELAIILTVGFLVLGPSQTIDTLRKARGFVRQARGAMQSMSEQTNKLLDEPKSLGRELMIISNPGGDSNAVAENGPQSTETEDEDARATIASVESALGLKGEVERGNGSKRR